MKAIKKVLINCFTLTLFFLNVSLVNAQKADSVCARVDQIVKCKIADYHFTFNKVVSKEGACNMELTYFLGSVQRFELNVYTPKGILNAAGSTERLSEEQLRIIMNPKATKIVIDQIWITKFDGTTEKISGTNAAIILETQK